MPLVSCRQKPIPGTQDSRPCRWLLSRSWSLPLAPKRPTNSKFLQIFGMTNGAYRPGQRMKHLAWQRRCRLTHDVPELTEPHSCIATRRLFHWAAPSVLLWATNMHLHLVVSRLHGYCAEVPDLLVPDFFSNFITVFFFLCGPTDRPKIRKRIPRFSVVFL